MCVYCEGKKPLAQKDYDLGILGRQRVYLEITNGVMRMGLENISRENTLEQFEESKVKIQCCPMCGKRLEE